jgi:hypothetical protein
VLRNVLDIPTETLAKKTLVDFIKITFGKTGCEQWKRHEPDQCKVQWQISVLVLFLVKFTGRLGGC